MNNKTKLILFIALFAVVMTAAVFGYRYLSKSYSPERLPDENKETRLEKIEAPDFTVYDKDGKEVKLSDYKGVPVVLNFWASWCPPCKSEMPHFNKVSKEYNSSELVFLMVDMVDGQRETVKTGKAYVEAQDYTFTVLYDTDQNAAYTYGITSLPSTVFINKEGIIEAGIAGAIDEETLRQGIALIEESEK